MRLKDARVAANLTQKQLAEKAGVHVSLIGKCETGGKPVGNLSARNYMSICDALDIDPHDLLEEDVTDGRGGDFTSDANSKEEA